MCSRSTEEEDNEDKWWLEKDAPGSSWEAFLKEPRQLFRCRTTTPANPFVFECICHDRF